MDYVDIGIHHAGSLASTSSTTNKTLHSSIGITDVSCFRRRCCCHYGHVGPNDDKLDWTHDMTVPYRSNKQWLVTKTMANGYVKYVV